MRTYPFRSLLIALAVLAGTLWLAGQAPPLQASIGDTVPILLQGRVTLQRPNAPAPDPSWVVPITVTFHLPGDPNPVYTWDVVTDESGNFSIVDTVEARAYDVKVKNIHTLRNRKQNVTIVEGVNTLDMGTLREGDANNDNRVNISDFAILRAAYFTEEGQPDFDPRTDFDEDNRINVRDFALLRSNYFDEGDIIVPRQPAQTVPQPVVLWLSPPVVRTEVGTPREVTLYMDTGTQPVVGSDVIVTFDPTLIQVVDSGGNLTTTVTAGDAFDITLINQVDNTQGRILFGAGTLGEPRAGPMTLFTFHVQAQAETFSTPLDITYADVVDPEGRALPTQVSDGRVQAGAFHYNYLAAAWLGWPPPPVYHTYFPLIYKFATPGVPAVRLR